MSLKGRILSGVLIFIISLFLIRGPLLRYFVANRVTGVEAKYGLNIDYQKLRFSGLSGIKLSSLSVVPSSQKSVTDTLLSVDYLEARLSFFKLLFFKTDLKELNADNIKISFVKRDSLSNFDFLFKSAQKSTKQQSVDSSNVNYARVTDRMFSLLLKVLPSQADIQKLKVSYTKDSYNLEVNLPAFKIVDNKFSVVISADENRSVSVMAADGILDDSERKISARLFARENHKFSVPFLKYRWGADLQFDTLAFEISATHKGSESTELKGSALAKGISVYHTRISPENVLLERGEFNYKFLVGRNFFELDSSSIATINRFSFSPYLRAQKDKKWHITASLNKSWFPSDDLFSSLPKGLFNNLEGLRTEGKLRYHFYLDLDFNNLDSLKLESVLKPDKFRIVSFGKTNFRFINDEFEYTAYENGAPVRSFTVGPSNPNFRTLDRISPFLQMAVLQSEDGGFFYHNGFLIESIKGALIQDIKERRFRRGGSTISMQLVKNVFLNRHKTLARKFEEVLIVWLIETNRLSPKDRMFEVYMNIIEWGPMIYGANEASRFYFDKDAKDININEAIFLASIIPSPKRALYSFDENFQLKPSLEGYYRLLAGRFRVKGLITEQEEAVVRPDVKLGNQAKRVIRERSIPVPAEDADSTLFNFLP